MSLEFFIGLVMGMMIASAVAFPLLIPAIHDARDQQSRAEQETAKIKAFAPKMQDVQPCLRSHCDETKTTCACLAGFKRSTAPKLQRLEKLENQLAGTPLLGGILQSELEVRSRHALLVDQTTKIKALKAQLLRAGIEPFKDDIESEGLNPVD